jgi:hypothetical protein
MKATEGVEVQFFDPSKMWAVPVANNRNQIAKRFLETDDGDFLMMLDDDVVPLSNPAVLAFADKDIIGIPAKCRQQGNVVNWVAYVKHPSQDLYSFES